MYWIGIEFIVATDPFSALLVPEPIGWDRRLQSDPKPCSDWLIRTDGTKARAGCDWTHRLWIGFVICSFWGNRVPELQILMGKKRKKENGLHMEIILEKKCCGIISSTMLVFAAGTVCVGFFSHCVYHSRSVSFSVELFYIPPQFTHRSPSYIAPFYPKNPPEKKTRLLPLSMLLKRVFCSKPAEIFGFQVTDAHDLGPTIQ